MRFLVRSRCIVLVRAILDKWRGSAKTDLSSLGQNKPVFVTRFIVKDTIGKVTNGVEEARYLADLDCLIDHSLEKRILKIRTWCPPGSHFAWLTVPLDRLCSCRRKT
jgi:hypothetical protein